jgi:hypothetical protein
MARGKKAAKAKEYAVEKDMGRAERLSLLRAAVSRQQGRAEAMSQVEFARWLGVGYSRWNNVENGFPVSRSLFRELKRKIPGITTAWIDDGDWLSLPGHVSKLLREADIPNQFTMPLAEHTQNK